MAARGFGLAHRSTAQCGAAVFWVTRWTAPAAPKYIIARLRQAALRLYWAAPQQRPACRVADGRAGGRVGFGADVAVRFALHSPRCVAAARARAPCPVCVCASCVCVLQVLMMCGNKADRKDDGECAVTEEQARQMALELDIPCVETSAKTGLHVEEAFVHVIEKIYQNSQLSKQAAAAAGNKAGAAGAPAAGAGAAAGDNKVDLSASGSGANPPSKCCS